MEQDIDFLSNNFNKSLEDPEIRDVYQKVEQYRKNNPEIVEIIKKKYRPSFIEPNTAGSYLWGCSQNYYGDVNKSCSLLCVNSIAFDEDEYLCQYSIWYYDKSLIQKNNVKSSKAFIYVNNDWKYFYDTDIRILKNCGIQFATILTTNNSKHKILIPMTSVDNLPITKEIETIQEKKETSYSYFWLIVLFIFFIFTYLVKENI